MKHSKFGNIRTRIYGHTFASRREARRYQALKLLERAGHVRNIICQERWKISINGVKVCTYVADFSYFDRYGKHIIEDVKGMRTPIYRLKAKLMLAVHGIKILET